MKNVFNRKKERNPSKTEKTLFQCSRSGDILFLPINFFHFNRNNEKSVNNFGQSKWPLKIKYKQPITKNPSQNKPLLVYNERMIKTSTALALVKIEFLSIS